MKKPILMLAALATLLAACNKTTDVAVPETGQEGESPVFFGAYVNRGVATKSGATGTLTTEMLKNTAVSKGFGVFGYYTNDEPYGPSAKPDFMYNQQVSFTGSAWDYSPIKYWPNNFGTSAASDAIDRLTFFAYAPFVDVTYSTGLVSGKDEADTENYASTGIIGLTRNTASGDPMVRYVASMDPAKCVDLCWGVAPGNFTSSVDDSNNNDVKQGEPFMNLIKPKTTDRLNFDFKHALSALNVQIDTDIDVTDHSGTDLIASETRIFVRSVTFEGFTTKGSLNLNSTWTSANTTPSWLDLAGTSIPDKTPVIVYDGRRDGKEGVASAVANNETPTGLNPVVIQSAPYGDATLTAGVTHEPVNLFNGSAIDTPVLVIPNGQSMKVTIVYDVETQDDHLAKTLSDGKTPGSSIENNITATVLLSDSSELLLASGKKYTVNLHLGLTSVKMDAIVSDWDEGDEGSANLPVNTSTSTTITIPGHITVTPGSGSGI